VFFFQITQSSVLAESIKLFPNGSMFWSQQMLVTVPEPQMNFADYPVDVQNFSLVLQSYAFDSNIINLNFQSNTAVKLQKTYQSGSPTISYNPLWSYQSYTAFINENPNPSPQYPGRSYDTIYINLSFKRIYVGKPSRSMHYRSNIYQFHA
jgi:hypothetical protein